MTVCCLYLSVNPGSAQSWTQTSADLRNWVAIAASADGTKLVAAANAIWASTNSGATWQQVNPLNPPWRSLAASADGARLVAATGNGIYTSTNFGVTWVTNNVALGVWYSAASSAERMSGSLTISQSGTPARL